MSGKEKKLPKGWEVKKLGEVCIVQRGSSPRPIKQYITDDKNGVNWIKIGDVGENDKYVTKTKQQITKEGAKKSRLVNEGDFILSNSMSYGRPYIMKISGYIHDGWFALRLPKNLNSNYFWYLLSSPLVKEQFTSLAAGSVVKNIKGDLVKKARLPIPPLSEQQKIVTLLDEAFEEIHQAQANIQQNIVNAKELFQSKLNEIFSQRGDGWEEKSLGELVKFKNGLNYSKSSKGQKINIVGVGDFKSNFYVPVNELSQIAIDGNLKEIYQLIDGDILVVRSNGNPALIGRCILAKNINSKTSHSGFTIRMRLTSDIVHPPFLCYFLKSTTAKTQLINSGTGVSIKSLNQKTLSSLKFNLNNSIEVQKEISKSLDEFSDLSQKLISNYQQKLQSLEEFKKSLLEKAFSGELTHSSNH